MDDPWLLPPHATLFYVGPPKTGTTAVQAAGAACREELLGHGVRYPGIGLNHRKEVNAFLGRGFGWRVAGERVASAPEMEAWTDLLAEIRGEQQRRVWFGHEYAASATRKQARRWRDELGPNLHVALTLRPYARMLPSMWQETLKRNAGQGSLEGWLKKVLKPKQAGDDVRRVRYDHAALIRLWSELIGAENVSVVPLDPHDPAHPFHAFERMLGLPRDLLLRAAPGGRSINRGLTVPEAELLRRLNGVTRAHDVEWSNHEWLVYHGATARLVLRTPGPDEARLHLPAWADELAREQERVVLAAIRDTGVRVLGDLTNLESGADQRPYVDHRSVESIPIDLAVEAIAGVVAVATGRDAEFVRTEESVLRKVRRDVTYHWRDMLREIGGRAVGKVRRAPAALTTRAAAAVERLRRRT